jgi:hypothetical protein
MGVSTVEENVIKAINDAIISDNPATLNKIFKSSVAWNDMLTLRKHIGPLVIEPCFYKTLFDWFTGNDPEIAREARILALWIDDLSFKTALFEYLNRTEVKENLFVVDYDSSEKEFKIEIPGVPGWGITLYERDNPDVYRLLLILDEFYIKTHPGSNRPHLQ